jgi:hypothetical protein
MNNLLYIIAVTMGFALPIIGGLYLYKLNKRLSQKYGKLDEGDISIKIMLTKSDCYSEVKNNQYRKSRNSTIRPSIDIEKAHIFKLPSFQDLHTCI